MNLSLRIAFFSSPGLQAGVNGPRVHLQAVSTAFPGRASATGCTRAEADVEAR